MGHFTFAAIMGTFPYTIHTHYTLTHLSHKLPHCTHMCISVFIDPTIIYITLHASKHFLTLYTHTHHTPPPSHTTQHHPLISYLFHFEMKFDGYCEEVSLLATHQEERLVGLGKSLHCAKDKVYSLLGGRMDGSCSVIRQEVWTEQHHALFLHACHVTVHDLNPRSWECNTPSQSPSLLLPSPTSPPPRSTSQASLSSSPVSPYSSPAHLCPHSTLYVPNRP